MISWKGRLYRAAAVTLGGVLGALFVWLLIQQHEEHSRDLQVQRIGSPCRTAFREALAARGLDNDNVVAQVKVAHRRPSSPQAHALAVMARDEQCRDQATLLTEVCRSLSTCRQLVHLAPPIREEVVPGRGNSNRPSGRPGGQRPPTTGTNQGQGPVAGQPPQRKPLLPAACLLEQLPPDVIRVLGC